jgi:hypothetical protein
VTLFQDTNSYQDYILDVTGLLQDIIADPSNSFGFLLKLKTETPYRFLAFASSDHPNTSLHPKLEICFTNLLTVKSPLIQTSTISVFPNPTSGSINIELKNLNTNFTSQNSFVIYDTIGNRVFENENTSKSSLFFDVSYLQNGMYYWVLTSGQNINNGKLILAK